jgi:hypothetical protein
VFEQAHSYLLTCYLRAVLAITTLNVTLFNIYCTPALRKATLPNNQCTKFHLHILAHPRVSIWQLELKKNLFLWEESSNSLSLTSFSTPAQSHLSSCILDSPIHRICWNWSRFCTLWHQNSLTSDPQYKVFRPSFLKRINLLNKTKQNPNSLSKPFPMEVKFNNYAYYL